MLLAQDELQPSLGLGIWSLLCLLVLIFGVIALVFYLVTGKSILRFFKKNIDPKVLFIILGSLVFGGCSSESSTPLEPRNSVDQLVSDYKLSRVSTISSKDDQSSLNFKTADEARLFLDQFKSSQSNLLSDPSEALVNAYMQGVSPSQKSEIDRYNAPRTVGVTDYVYGDVYEGNEAPPGSGTFSQRYLPWNRISVYAQWDANRSITNLQSFLTGVTVGLSWNQLGYNTVSTLDNGSVIVKVTYTVSAVLIVEGVGTIWSSQPSEAYVVLYGSDFTGGGTGGGIGRLEGCIFGSYEGAYSFGVRIVGQK